MTLQCHEPTFKLKVHRESSTKFGRITARNTKLRKTWIRETDRSLAIALLVITYQVHLAAQFQPAQPGTDSFEINANFINFISTQKVLAKKFHLETRRNRSAIAIFERGKQIQAREALREDAFFNGLQECVFSRETKCLQSFLNLRTSKVHKKCSKIILRSF